MGGSKANLRNVAKICTFFIRKECNRGQSCPYRHTDITETDLESIKKGQGPANDKIMNRYMGVNDPVAKKIIEKIEKKE